MKIIYLIILMFVLNPFAHAQDVWSLQKCIEHAQKNNLSLKQSQLLIEQAKLGEQLNKYSRYPSLNANTSFGYQFGRTIDPTTNSFVSEGIGGQTLNLDAFVNLYNGGRTKTNIARGEIDRQAAEADKLQLDNDIALLVATTYLNVLFAKEQLAASKQRLDLTNEQLVQTEKLIAAGAIPANDKLDVLAQQARNEQDIVIQENTLSVSLLNLKNLLQLEPDLIIDVEVPNLNLDETYDVEALGFNGIYNQALNTQPFIQAAEYRLRSAEMGVKVAAADRYPSLNLFGGIDTRFATKNPAFAEDDVELGSSIPVVIDGALSNIQTFGPVRIGDVPYFEQLNDNLGQSVGLSLRVPIYNNNSVRIAEEQAKLNITSIQLQNAERKQQLKTDVQSAITNVKAAKLQYDAAEKTVNASKASYDNAKKRFQLGAINAFTLSTIKNNLDQSQVEYIVAKYDYIFKIQVVEFYMGKSINLN